MADKSLREELESAFDADDKRQYAEAQGRVNKRKARADSSFFGRNDKAGAMGETLNAYSTTSQKDRDGAASKAFDHIQNIDESMAEDAATRLKKRSSARWEAARAALKAAKK